MEIETIIDYIRSVIREIREENDINGIVKDSIFEILEKRCTVIYFPTNDKNRGFHIRKLVKDVKMISGLRRVVEKAEENPDISKALVSKLKADYELEDIA